MTVKTVMIAANLFSDGIPLALPRHDHDCEQCVFLGRRHSEPNTDLWLCTAESLQSLILRASGEPSDYQCLPVGTAVKIARAAGPGSVWSEAVSRYDDFQGAGTGDALPWELDEPYETVVGLYGDLRVRKTDRNVFVRDQWLNPIGIARIVKNSETRLVDRYSFRPDEGVVGSQIAGDQEFASLRALYLYCMTIQQDMVDGGH